MLLKFSVRNLANGVWRRAYSTALEAFEAERVAQASLIKRINKITVKCNISEQLSNDSAVALVDGEPWNMHMPLNNDCAVQFLSFKEHNPDEANKAFWRSCAYVLGYILEKSFKPEANVSLVKPSDCSVEDGYFGYDFYADLDGWRPTQIDLANMSRLAAPLINKDEIFTPLRVNVEKARAMFSSNQNKLAQLEGLSADDSVTAYRMGSLHVDMMDGPLIAATRLIGRYSITGLHPLSSDSRGQLYRAVGVALPRSIEMHSWTYQLLLKNSLRDLNVSKKDLPFPNATCHPPAIHLSPTQHSLATESLIYLCSIYLIKLSISRLTENVIMLEILMSQKNNS